MEDILKIVYYSVENTMVTDCLDDESIIIESFNFESLTRARKFIEDFISDKTNKNLKQNKGEIYGNVLDSYTYTDNKNYGYNDYGVQLKKVVLNLIRGE
jgi:hypothetical protein